MADDPELERRLDAMFASLRPSAAFDANLAARLRRRPWWTRLAEGNFVAPRLAPALAAVLIIAGGASYLALHRPGPGGSSASTVAQGAVSRAGFGNLPRPTISSGVRSDQSFAPALPLPSLGQNAGAGYRITAALPDLPAVADVYRYAEPVGAQRSELARNLGSMSGLTVLVLPSRPDAGLPPTFSAEAPGSPADGRQATAEAAAALLRQHSLMPSYTVRPISGEGSVTFARELALGRGKVLLVDGHGGPIGLRVTFGAGSARISGPVDLPLTRASYPLRSMAEAIASVVSEGGTGGGAVDRVDLVYVVASAGGQGYLEPALFFSGPAVSVLVPAVADDHLTP